MALTLRGRQKCPVRIALKIGPGLNILVLDRTADMFNVYPLKVGIKFESKGREGRRGCKAHDEPLKALMHVRISHPRTPLDQVTRHVSLQHHGLK
eukprot:1152002-Amphidinium_carterae.2